MTEKPPTQGRLARRSVLRAAGWTTAIAAVGGAGAGAGAGGSWWAGARLDTAGKVAFTRALRVPPLAPPVVDSAANLLYELVAAAGESELLAGRSTPTWGFNGAYLGPTLRAPRGATIEIAVRNELPETTTVHWHGAHLPARFDGGPHQPIEPGGTWRARWLVDQPPATLWYHPHPHGATSKHVHRGLAGLLLVDDPATEDRTGLPGTYGIDDVPIVLSDVKFTDEAHLEPDASLLAPAGRLGDTVLVNGVAGAFLDVRRTLTRLRVLNASDARVYALALDDHRPFHLVGTDGGLLEQPVELTELLLSPGERVEIVVSMSAGERRVLRSNPADLGTNAWDRRLVGADDRLDILELRATVPLEEARPLPTALPGEPPPTPAVVTATRDFELLRYQINGRAMDMSRIDLGVTVDTDEVWRVRNIDAIPHNFHVHDVQMRVLDIDGRTPAHLRGPKDTVLISPQSTATLALRFRDHTDPDRPYMHHCHMLTHEDRGMMGQFVVLAPGEEIGAVPSM